MASSKIHEIAKKDDITEFLCHTYLLRVVVYGHCLATVASSKIREIAKKGDITEFLCHTYFYSELWSMDTSM